MRTVEVRRQVPTMKNILSLAFLAVGLLVMAVSFMVVHPAPK
jgi:hypothetical protein